MRCINCQEPIPGNANYCAKCGEHLSISEHTPILIDEQLVTPTIKILHRPAALKSSRYRTVDKGITIDTQRNGSRMTVTPQQPRITAPVSSSQTNSSTQSQVIDREESDDDLQSRGTWERIVTHKTPSVAPLLITPPAIPVVYKTPAGSTPPAIISVRRTLPKKASRLPTRLFSWVSILALIGLLLAGVFGLTMSFSRGFLAQSSQSNHVFGLQVSPSTAAIGRIITLHGSAFSPSGRIGLTRDSNITLIDTGGTNIIHANSDGSFSDRVFIDSSWGAGSHIIHAEDAVLHKVASFTVFVTGHSASLGPSHLLFSADFINLGTADQATNSTQMITLSNTGGSQITWQATATQSWLMISPKSGIISYGQNMTVAVAADRSNLKVGSYASNVLFTSNTGQATLPVKMVVTQLKPGHNPVLQLTPAVLSFTGMDGSTNPLTQVVTVSNPGVLSLQWNATSVTNDGSSWLTVHPLAGTVNKGESQAVTIGVNTSTMLPGVYSGSLTFTSQGTVAAKNSPQTIFVSLLVLPQCSIQPSPGGLTFAGVYLQPSPAQQVMNIGVSQGCSTSLPWSTVVTTSSGGNWLSIGPTGGATPSSPAIHVNSAGLQPGTYNGSIIFNWPGGTQNLPVTFTVGQATTPILAATHATIPLVGIIGQTGQQTKVVTISNMGGGTLFWHATAVTAVGGTWLAISPSTGTLNSHQSTPITVTAQLPKTWPPGNYAGTITVSGTDSFGRQANGSPLSIPVDFAVQAPCSFATTSSALTFKGVVGGTNPLPQSAVITASGACTNALTWTATPAAGATWLTATRATGTVSVTGSSATSVGVVLTGLAAGTYTSSVTLNAIDSVTKLAVGKPRVIAVRLTVQPVCTLQTPSTTAETFSSEAGLNPVSQSFAVGVIGACTGNVSITPTVTSGSGWLAISPASALVSSGGSATFTVAVRSAKLSAGQYTGSISLAAVNSGKVITGSPQAVGITLRNLAAPALTAATGAVTSNAAAGTISKPVTIMNNGGLPLNWTAALGSGAPGYLSLSATSGSNLAGGTSTTINVMVDTTGLQGGTSVTTSVVISAIDPATGLSVVGSPVTRQVTFYIPPPQMVLSSTALAFTTKAGIDPGGQTINIQNPGGNTLTWTVSAPSQSWLTISSTSGSDAAGQSTPLTFNVNSSTLKPSAVPYTATVVITPSVGAAVTITVTVTVS